MDPFLIQKPIVTEKSTDLQQAGKYVFMVSPRATKPEVKKAVYAIYKVNVTEVHMTQQHPKQKRFRGKKSRHGGYKKAIVTLKKGERIDLGQ